MVFITATVSKPNAQISYNSLSDKLAEVEKSSDFKSMNLYAKYNQAHREEHNLV